MNSSARNPQDDQCADAPSALALCSDCARILAVQQIGDPWLTAQQAKIILALYAAGKPLNACKIEDALEDTGRDLNNVVKVQICRARQRLLSPSIITRWGIGYDLAPALRTQLDALFGVKAAA
jgi:hypothetical protein